MNKTSLGELIADTISHGVGLLLAISALVLMLVSVETSIELFAALVYGITLIVLYLSSTLFHAFPDKMRRTNSVFQRLDHSSIFLLISGTYTPFLLLVVRTFEGYLLLGVLWGLTILAITLKSIWVNRYHAVFVILYIVMGWSVLWVVSDVIQLLESGLFLLFLGGISYTFGVVFYVSRFKYHHFIWHIFVLLGSVSHFFAIYYGILI
ncbi:MAG: hemolysin III family protein [Candidatus Izimaplasma sp.]|nr:hemolysin III family protein [Candidatus Izimaplasma bacterium]